MYHHYLWRSNFSSNNNPKIKHPNSPSKLLPQKSMSLHLTKMTKPPKFWEILPLYKECMQTSCLKPKWSNSLPFKEDYPFRELITLTVALKASHHSKCCNKTLPLLNLLTILSCKQKVPIMKLAKTQWVWINLLKYANPKSANHLSFSKETLSKWWVA